MPYNYLGYNTNQYMNPYYQNSQLQRMQEYNRQPSLLGKVVDGIDVVRGLDIPLDGSTSYFPLADGSAIATKQLQQDGTSRIIIYKPDIKEKEEIRYVTESDIKDIREELEELRKKIGEEGKV